MLIYTLKSFFLISLDHFHPYKGNTKKDNFEIPLCLDFFAFIPSIQKKTNIDFYFFHLKFSLCPLPPSFLFHVPQDYFEDTWKNESLRNSNRNCWKAIFQVVVDLKSLCSSLSVPLWLLLMHSPESFSKTPEKLWLMWCGSIVFFRKCNKRSSSCPTFEIAFSYDVCLTFR